MKHVLKTENSMNCLSCFYSSMDTDRTTKLKEDGNMTRKPPPLQRWERCGAYSLTHTVILHQSVLKQVRFQCVTYAVNIV